MNHVLPKDSSQMMDWSWDKYIPFFDYLENSGLTSENISDWMKYWSDLSELIGEVGTSVYVSTTVDTADEEAKSRYHKFLEDISENVSSRNQALKIKFLESGLSPDNFEIPLRGMKSEVDLFSKDNFAWVVDNDDESKLITTMKKASRLMIIANTNKGDQTTDHYSMMGFTKAYNTAKKVCS